MSNRASDALHHIHTATNDVLEGYREMCLRAEPEVQTVVRRLTDMHERHAAEQGGELARLREAGMGDSSVQGSVNKVVVILRDWLSAIDRDVLPAVRDGESLSEILCVRHSMSTRSMNATQDEDDRYGGQGGAAAILSRVA